MFGFKSRTMGRIDRKSEQKMKLCYSCKNFKIISDCLKINLILSEKEIKSTYF